MNVRTGLFGTAGLLTTGFGLALLLAPEQVQSFGPVSGVISSFSRINPTFLLLSMGVLVAGYAGIVARTRPAPETAPTLSEAQARFRTAGTKPPEDVTASNRTVAASGIDGDIDAAVKRGGPELQNVREHLRETAVSVYATTGESTEPQQAVTEGTWTDDPVAASFLSDEEGPTPSVHSRIRLWLRPQEERRFRIERTVEAIENCEEQR